MARTIVVTQSNYLPWRGYFDMFRSADEVILLDSVQYTRRDWRNRNQIKTASGLAWLTVPVEVSGRYHQAVDETRIAGAGWADQHRRAIDLAYRKAPHFAAQGAWLSALLGEAARHARLTDLNEELLRALCGRLGITVPIGRCTEVLERAALAAMDPSERLAALAEARGATRYLTGPAARAYLDPAPFVARGIEVAWMSYAGYPDYPQLWGAFEPRVSIVDPLLNLGEAAQHSMDKVAA
jgi:hypothetical protein